jgi:CheY-like chemotaxis protein
MSDAPGTAGSKEALRDVSYKDHTRDRPCVAGAVRTASTSHHPWTVQGDCLDALDCSCSGPLAKTMSTTRSTDELERQLEQLTRELELANETRSRLLVASHDLRQPLHALGLFAAQLRDHVHEPGGARIIEQIDAAVSAMNARLNVLRDVARDYSKSDEAGQPSRSAAAPMPTRGSLDAATGKLVVVIDDDPLILEGTCGLLRSWGCNVVSADSVAALTALIDRQRLPDLIISDLHLSNGETGIDAIAALRKASRNTIPAFLVSADTSADATREAQTNGYHLLPKPVDPMSLRAILGRMLKRGRTPGDVQREFE